MTDNRDDFTVLGPLRRGPAGKDDPGLGHDRPRRDLHPLWRQERDDDGRKDAGGPAGPAPVDPRRRLPGID